MTPNSRICAMENTDLLETVDQPNIQTTLYNDSNLASAPAHDHNQLEYRLKKIRLPKTDMEFVKLYFRLIYERRNLVKIPAFSIASLSLFLQSSLACFLYIISFRETAWYRLSVELFQQHAEAKLPPLKAAVLSQADSPKHGPLAEAMKHHSWVMGSWWKAGLYIDHLNATEVTDSLAEHCDHFIRFKERDWYGMGVTQALGFCMCVSFPHFEHLLALNHDFTKACSTLGIQNSLRRTIRPAVLLLRHGFQLYSYFFRIPQKVWSPMLHLPGLRMG